MGLIVFPSQIWNSLQILGLILFENRVVVDIIGYIMMRSYWSRPYDNRDRNGRDASFNQHITRTRSHQRQGGLFPSWFQWMCGSTDNWIRISCFRNRVNKFLLFYYAQFVGLCYGNHRKYQNKNYLWLLLKW